MTNWKDRFLGIFFPKKGKVIMHVQPLRMEVSLGHPTIVIKRGKESFEYFIVAFNVLSAFLIAVISISEIQTICKIVFISFSVFGVYYLCFKSFFFRNRIVGFFVRSRDREDRTKL